LNINQRLWKRCGAPLAGMLDESLTVFHDWFLTELAAYHDSVAAKSRRTVATWLCNLLLGCDDTPFARSINSDITAEVSET
jgi:hypothetical protein